MVYLDWYFARMTSRGALVVAMWGKILVMPNYLIVKNWNRLLTADWSNSMCESGREAGVLGWMLMVRR